MNRTKLAKVLGMMGSAHDGEVLTAAKTAEALVREAGLTWFDLVGGVPACGLDWMETQKGGALVDLPKDIRIEVFEKNMLWKFLVNIHQKAVYDQRVFQTREMAILAAEEKYFDEYK